MYLYYFIYLKTGKEMSHKENGESDQSKTSKNKVSDDNNGCTQYMHAYTKRSFSIQCNSKL